MKILHLKKSIKEKKSVNSQCIILWLMWEGRDIIRINSLNKRSVSSGQN